jgi:hypothetical protein
MAHDAVALGWRRCHGLAGPGVSEKDWRGRMAGPDGALDEVGGVGRQGRSGDATGG